MLKSLLLSCLAHANIVASKLSEIFNTLWGWTCAAWILCINFFAGYETSIVAMIVCVALDTAWGIAAQIKQNRFAISALGRDGMLSKLALYASVIIGFIHIENMVNLESHLTVIIISSLICLVEIWSMSGSALIINPQMPFLRLFRRVLTGEIARKLDIKEEEVEAYLNHSEITIDNTES